jgi:hypothetical protein
MMRPPVDQTRGLGADTRSGGETGAAAFGWNLENRGVLPGLMIAE